MAQSLDIYEEIIMPIEMRSYLRNYGFNFSKNACEFAVGMMRGRNKEKIEFKDKEKVYEILKKYGITLEHDNGYNATYAFHMGTSDYLKSSIPDEQRLAMYVKDVIDDPDNKGGNVFRKFLADCDAKGIVVEWEDIL